jgi:hypothetical protein
MTALIVSLRRASACRRARHVRLLCALALGIVIAAATCVTAGSAWAFGPFPEPFGPEAFGVYQFENSFENPNSSAVVQAGAHPYSMTTTVVFNHTVTDEVERDIKSPKGRVPEGLPETTANIFGDAKDVAVNLPPGLILNPNVTPVKCTEAELETKASQGGGCPAASAVGVSIPFVRAYPCREEFGRVLANC